MKKFKYIYGPVSSWRFGRSLGVDLVSQKRKICSFNCCYCQVGPDVLHSAKRKIFIPTKSIMDEIRQLPKLQLDCITFSGKGEPTLALNLGEVIERLKKVRKEKIVILTNSSLLYRKSVRRDAAKADIVACKLDAFSQDSLKHINSSSKEVTFNKILKGISLFRKEFSKKMVLQIMLVDSNKKHVKKIAEIAKLLNPDEIQLNTPLRPSKVYALSRVEVNKIKSYFCDFSVISVYDEPHKRHKHGIDASSILPRRGLEH